jgi:hypothetical protein
MVLFILNAEARGTAENLHACWCWCAAQLGYFRHLKALLDRRGRSQIAGVRQCREIDVKMIVYGIGTAICLAREDRTANITTIP